MKPKPVNVFPKFTKSKLGTKWIHIPTQTVYELRRYPGTPPELSGLHLYDRKNETTIDNIITKDWKPL